MPAGNRRPSASRCCWRVLLLLLLLHAVAASSASTAAASSYAEHGDALVHELAPLARRARRQAAAAPAGGGVGNDDLLEMNAGTLPPDYELESENDGEDAGTTEGRATTKHIVTEHTYYNMTTISSASAVFAATYVDIGRWISEGGAKGQPTSHDHLSGSYRKAAGVRLSFEFPFYGHLLSNLTIATGGFLYVGDQTHSWLAATQYIAPLMANFDTMSNSSTIKYGDDGKRIIVEWSEVLLRDNNKAGPFTFQAHLWKNGNITFVYKEVPMAVSNISDAQHPCKLGISDAYLFNHKVSSLSQSMPQQNKRVIHEYHRISIPPEKITSRSVVMLKALPTCLDATTCDQCIRMQLKAFKCSWCNPKDSGKQSVKEGAGDGGAGAEKPFCSDQLGLHRRRQEWIEGNCQLQEENQYCKADELLSDGAVNGSTAVPTPAAAAVTSTVAPDGALPPATTTATVAQQQPTGAPQAPKAAGSARTKGADEAKASGGGGGLAFITLFMLVGISVSVWMLYAYFNPHTRSGQLLIKYRPSKWQIPSSHVRYSASVHM